MSHTLFSYMSVFVANFWGKMIFHSCFGLELPLEGVFVKGFWSTENLCYFSFLL